jgi:hypothetical protein
MSPGRAIPERGKRSTASRSEQVALPKTVSVGKNVNTTVGDKIESN